MGPYYKFICLKQVQLGSILNTRRQTVNFYLIIAYYCNISSDLRKQLDQKRKFIAKAYKRIESLQFLIDNIRTNNLTRYRERRLILKTEIRIEEGLIREHIKKKGN